MGPCNSRSGRVNIYSEQSTPITEISQHGPGTVAFLERYECSFTPTEILGSGAYSTVYKCVDKESREECAAKVIQLKKMAEDEVDALHIEVGILEEIKHPNVDGGTLWFRPIRST
jgi:serine/threonine protein kinase|mmetsp:Transcript_22846/g.78639  ORF Transcript_22846/g.78639 Transcript_22846/m.78639 type:complete len:115 (+) Transcript_22846:66-410(+)